LAPDGGGNAGSPQTKTMTITYNDLIAPRSALFERFLGLYAELQPARNQFRRLFTSADSPIHGADHWVRVGLFGLAIAKKLRERGLPASPVAEPGALEEAVILAAFFHDCARWSDGGELDHGRAGEEVWRWYAAERKFPDGLAASVSQALLFHVDHPAVDPAAGPVAVCLCNADRLDRVRLGESPKPKLMYDDGAWRELEPLSERLLDEVTRKVALVRLAIWSGRGMPRPFPEH